VPSSDRAKHLFDVQIPMLFLQGTRDELAHLPLIESLASELKGRATLELIPTAIIHFMCPNAAGAPTRKSSRVWRIRWRTGSQRRSCTGKKQVEGGRPAAMQRQSGRRRATIAPDVASGIIDAPA
jgi:hypothetical protein